MIDHISISRAGAQLGRVMTPAQSGTIGRLPDNWLVLPAPAIARYQAELVCEDGCVLLINLGSAELVLLDGQPLLPHQPVRLTDGTLVTIGPFLLEYTTQATPGLAQPLAAIEPTPGRVAEPHEPSDRGTTSLPCLPDGPSRYLYELPVAYHDEAGFLGRYLKLFEATWEPFEHRQSHIDMYFRPETCPPEILGWLASWLDTEIDALLPSGRQRRLAAEALDLARWRGTRYALTRLVELIAGQTPLIEADLSQPFMIILRITEPPASSAERITVRKLVLAAMPAHITCRFEGEGWSL